MVNHLFGLTESVKYLFLNKELKNKGKRRKKQFYDMKASQYMFSVLCSMDGR